MKTPTEDYHQMQKCEYYQSGNCDCLTECSANPIEKEESQEELSHYLIDLINRYWTFNDDQRHTHTWHDKQDCLDEIRKQFQGKKD